MTLLVLRPRASDLALLPVTVVVPGGCCAAHTPSTTTSGSEDTSTPIHGGHEKVGRLPFRDCRF